MPRAASKTAKPANAPKRRLYRRGWASDSPTTCVRVSRLATAWSLSSDRTWSRRPAARSSGSVSSNGENHVSACPGNALGVRHENFRYARVLCAVNDDVSGYADHGKIHRIHADSLTDGVVVSGDNVIDSAKRSEEHTSELQSLAYLVCRLLLEKKN